MGRRPPDLVDRIRIYWRITDWILILTRLPHNRPVRATCNVNGPNSIKKKVKTFLVSTEKTGHVYCVESFFKCKVVTKLCLYGKKNTQQSYLKESTQIKAVLVYYFNCKFDFYLYTALFGTYLQYYALIVKFLLISTNFQWKFWSIFRIKSAAKLTRLSWFLSVNRLRSA